MTLALLLLFAQAAGSPAEGFERAKREAAPAELYALLWAMPKGGDIHHHFGLATFARDLYRAATDPAVTANEFFTRLKDSGCEGDPWPGLRWLNLQRAQYRKLTPCQQGDYVNLRSLSETQREEWISSLILDKPGEGRDEFFERIVMRVTGIVRDPAVNLHVTAENLKRYKREGLLYVEGNSGALRLLKDDGEYYSGDEAAGLLRRRLAQEDLERDGVPMRLQLTAIRFQPNAEEQVEQAYEWVSKHRDLWVGVNIAGREDNGKGYPQRLLPVFRKMRRTYPGVRLSLHGGEKDAPGDDVKQTLLLGAERIGHGINILSDPDTYLLLRKSKFLVEINLISNRLLEYYPDLSQHPFPELLRTGVPVCLNTDDAGVWDSNLTDEYFTAVRTFNLSWDEIVEMGRNSLAYSFAEPALKDTLLAQYAERIRAFESKLASGGWRGIVRDSRPEPSGYARRNFGLD